MALALTYTHAGSTNAITTMPGSPSAGDTISMSNGTHMLTWTYNNHNSNVWYPDAPYFSTDGTNYYLAAYCRDGLRWESSFTGAGDNGLGPSHVVTVISATASNITLQVTANKTITPFTTTASTTVTSGSTVITPASMSNIVSGASLNITGGTGTAETVTVTAITGSTFTASFVNAHSGTYTIAIGTVPATVMTQTAQVSMISATQGIIFKGWLAPNVAVPIGSNNRISDWGLCCFSFGPSSNVTQMYDGVRGPDKISSNTPGQSHRVDAIYYSGNASSNPGNRHVSQSGNGIWRNYAAGMAVYTPSTAQWFQPASAPNPSAGTTVSPFPNGLIHTIACDPASLQILMTLTTDPVLSNNEPGPGGTVTSISNTAVGTTATTAVTSGSTVITPASMAGIYVNLNLLISGGTGISETVTVSAITGSTFTAPFVNSHSGTYNIAANTYPIPNANINGKVVEGELEFTYMYQGQVNWFKGIDSGYTAQHDFNPMWMRAGTNYGNQTFNGTNMPQATSNTATDGTALYLSYVYGMMVPPVPAQTVHGNQVAKWCLPYSINYWTDNAFARPNVGGTDTYIGGQNAYWQTLPTMATTIYPLLASTLTLDSSTYGFGQSAGSTQLNSVITSLAIQALARHVKYAVGNGATDATTMIDKLAAVLVNFQQTTGVQTGAIYKIRHNEYNPQQFGCMEGKHPVSVVGAVTANTDEPHVSAYAMAEAVDALLDYYAVRGNQTLGSTTAAAALDAACNWLLLSQQSEGGWLPCTSATNGIPAYIVYNNTPQSVGAFKSNAYNYMNKGFEASGTATIDLAASLLRWSQLAAVSGSGSAASATVRQNWLNAAQKAARFVMDSENVTHGCYEYGEDYNTLSHYGTRMLVRGFSRLGKYTGASSYTEHALYYFEQGLLMLKRIDEVVNNFSTGGHDIHSSCLISTIDNTGVVSGEGAPDLAAFLQEIPSQHPSLQAYHWYYLWGWLAHITWGFRNATSQTATIGNTTYTAQVMATSPVPDPSSYAYLTPGTNACGFWLGMDDTHFQYFPMGAALLLTAVQEMASSSSQYTQAICLESSSVEATPAGRTVIVTNPQGTSQTTTITIKNMAGKSLTQDGVPIAAQINGAHMTVSLTLTAGQVTKLIAR